VLNNKERLGYFFKKKFPFFSNFGGKSYRYRKLPLFIFEKNDQSVLPFPYSAFAPFPLRIIMATQRSLYFSTPGYRPVVYADSRFIRAGFTSADNLERAHRLLLHSPPLAATNNNKSLQQNQFTTTTTTTTCPSLNTDVDAAGNDDRAFQQFLRQAMDLSSETAPLFTYHNHQAPQRNSSASSSLRYFPSQSALQASPSFVDDLYSWDHIENINMNFRACYDLPNCVPDRNLQQLSINKHTNTLAAILDRCVYIKNITFSDWEPIDMVHLFFFPLVTLFTH
jgi:hypothetical protein